MIFVITILVAKATAEVTHFINACYKALLLKAVYIEKKVEDKSYLVKEMSMGHLIKWIKYIHYIIMECVASFRT